MSPLQLWGGVECTCNRVGNHYYDQLTRTGHWARASDLDRFAALGLRTLRHPILWEHVAPEGLARASWDWADERLARVRQLSMRPIVGLVHHGSGPRLTSLVDESFVEGLGAYAGAVAARYPWVDAFTPVNEPLTTARFSALYGHWYPHAHDDRSFAIALINQVRGTRAAMKAIRAINPAAQLIQTEDLCEVRSTGPLAHQADFENTRRWLSLDLLAGFVDRSHPLAEFLVRAGVTQAALDDLVADPCPPDVIGINYYLTSDRFLDHRVSPAHAAAAGNGRDRYVDVEAVRVPGIGLAGHERLLSAAFARYRTPVALTEVHAACSREEQIRWFVEAWAAAQAARRKGVDVVAVTAWSLLGAFDWDSLVTRNHGRYESGAFDGRSDPPRPTALARVLHVVATSGDPPDLPVLDTEGWWRRVGGAAAPAGDGSRAELARGSRQAPRRLLIAGGKGTLGRALAAACEARGLAYVLADRGMVDIADARSVAAAVDRHRPWAILNAAGYVNVDAAEHNAEDCRRENTRGAVVLADACAARGIRLVTFSTDLVFDGEGRVPYVESDRTGPLNAYGRSKLEAERHLREHCPDALIVRTSAFFGPHDCTNFVTHTLDRLRRGLPTDAAHDLTITATYVPDLADAALDLLIDEEPGIWHLANPGPVTWWELARAAAERAGLNGRLINAVPWATLGWSAPRPAYSALASRRGQIMRPLQEALDAYTTDVLVGRPEVQSSCA
jgi:dTDP-4-dehydrorhamnose reductase